MLRRHWLAILVVAALGYFGLAAAPTLAQQTPAQHAAAAGG